MPLLSETLEKEKNMGKMSLKLNFAIVSVQSVNNTFYSCPFHFEIENRLVWAPHLIRRAAIPLII